MSTPDSIRQALMVVTLAAVVGVYSGCGYSLAGRGSFLPASIQTIGIPLFSNSTPFYELEQALTDRVRSEFIGRGKYKVLPQETGVDAVLRGEVTGITLTPAAFNDQQQATRYAITMTARIEFRDLTLDKVLWENPALVFREEYEVTSAGSATDPKAFFGQDANALQRVSQDFARTVVSAILEAF
ncbi:MAG: LptE family protein [Vicinamibacterales bacterium]